MIILNDFSNPTYHRRMYCLGNNQNKYIVILYNLARNYFCAFRKSQRLITNGMSHSISQTSHLVSVAKLMTHNDGRTNVQRVVANKLCEVTQVRNFQLYYTVIKSGKYPFISQGLLVGLPGRSSGYSRERRRPPEHPSRS